jgi:hypothetical protein
VCTLRPAAVEAVEARRSARAQNIHDADLWSESDCGTLAAMLRHGLLVSLLALGSLSACAYPRRSTPLSTVSHDVAKGDVSAPPELWRFVLVRADIPPTQRSGLPWDEDGGPDPFMKLMVDGRELWESPRLNDTTHPQFDTGPETNLALPRNTRLRFELWDKDGVTSEPIGIYEGRILGDAIVGTDVLIKLEGGATLTVRVEKPAPLVGTGIAQYEIRRHAMVVLKIVPNSPASRAGITPGDRITEIDGKLLDELRGGKAESALAQASQNGSELTLEKDGAYRRVKLDNGYVWLSMK